MEKYNISIRHGIQYYFQVEQYPHHSSGSCKYRIYQGNRFVASLEPGGKDLLHICQNPGDIDPVVLDLLAEQIETRHPRTALFDNDEDIDLDR